MDALLLDQEPETEIPELRFPRFEPFEIAVYECKIFNRWGCLIRVLPAKRIQEVLNEVYTEPTYQSLAVTPAMEIGLASRVWTVRDLINYSS